MPLGVDGVVDHHNGVLFDDPDEHEDTHKTVDVQILTEKQERGQRAHPGSREPREDGEGMDEALIQHAKNKVDDDDGHQQQQPEAAHAILEGGCFALEAGGYSFGQDRADGIADLLHGVAQGDARSGIEGKSDGWKLPEVIDRERPGGALDFRDRLQRHEGSAGRAEIELSEGFRGVLIGWFHFQNYVILVRGSVDAGDLAGAVSIVEGVFNITERDAEGRCLVALDFHIGLGAGNLEIAANIRQGRQSPQGGFYFGGSFIERG